MKQIDTLLGQRLKYERTMAGFTQGELGKQLGVSPQQVQKYEMGINRVSVGRLIQMSEILRFDPTKLITGLTKKRRNKKEDASQDNQFIETSDTIESIFARIKRPTDRRLLLELGRRLAN